VCPSGTRARSESDANIRFYLNYTLKLAIFQLLYKIVSSVRGHYFFFIMVYIDKSQVGERGYKEDNWYNPVENLNEARISKEHILIRRNPL